MFRATKLEMFFGNVLIYSKDAFELKLVKRQQTSSRKSAHVHVAAMGPCSWRLKDMSTMEAKVMQKGTESVSSILSSPLQSELESIGAPRGCVTVEHGALCKGHVIF